MKPFDEIFKSVRRGDVTNQLTLKESQEGINFVAQNDTNNGFVKTVSNDEYKVFKGNSIIIGRQTGIAYYQPNDFITTDGVLVLEPLEFDFNRYSGLFFTSVLLKKLQKFGYTNTVSAQKLKELSLCLPYKIRGEKKVIDFYFIKKYIETLEAERIETLEAERIETLEAYLTVTNLRDYHLTKNDEKVLDKFAKLSDTKSRVEESEVFQLSQVFNLSSSKKKFNANMIEFGGKFPYVARGDSNNGIRGYITESEEFLNPANTISFGQDTATMFYQKEPYFTGDKIKVLRTKEVELDRYKALYLITSLRKSFSTFSWGSSSFNEKVLKETDVKLPIQNNQIDYQFMSDFIRAVEKLVIKDLVIWADKKIAATKEIVDGL